MVYIYGLYSDDINNIRYVGKTIHPEKRLKEHIRTYKSEKLCYKHNWVKSQLKKGKEIKMVIIEECNNDNWQDREKYWISKYDNLTNISIGGEGGAVYLYDISYDDAKKIVQSLGIKSKSVYFKYVKENKITNLPYSPDNHFKSKGCWVSWGDFFGTNRKQDNLLSLDYI